MEQLYPSTKIEGRPNNKRYHTETTFIDNHGNTSYFLLQKSLNFNEKFQAKKYFEAYRKKFGVTIRH